jgi:hypothetical protein
MYRQGQYHYSSTHSHFHPATSNSHRLPIYGDLAAQLYSNSSAEVPQNWLVNGYSDVPPASVQTGSILTFDPTFTMPPLKRKRQPDLFSDSSVSEISDASIRELSQSQSPPNIIPRMGLCSRCHLYPKSVRLSLNLKYHQSANGKNSKSIPAFATPAFNYRSLNGRRLWALEIRASKV